MTKRRADPPAAPPPSQPADPDDPPQALDLSSDGLPDPVSVPDGDADRQAVRFRLVVPDLTRRGGSGTLALSTGPLTFNDYGDGTPGGQAPVAELAVTLHGLEDTSFDGTLYEVRLPDKRADGRLWLYFAPEPADEHRLIVWPTEKGRRADPTKMPGWGEGNPERVIAMHPPSLPADPLPATPGRSRPRLSGLVRNPDRTNAREPDPQQVDVKGGPSADGELELDPNHLHLGTDGRVGGSTLLARMPFRVTFRPVGPDPLGRGCTAFELVPTDADRERYDMVSARPGGRRTYTIVYSAEARGPHRLVVKEGDAVRQVVTLTDFDRENRLRPIRDRLRLPPGERAALDKLAALSGSAFSFGVAGRHVWTVTVSGDATRLDPLMAEFPQLWNLSYEPAKLPASGLPSLARLPELTSVRIVGDVADDGLACLTTIPKLRTVQVFASSGMTPRGLTHLARLPKVVLLQVSLPEPVLDPPAADEALRVLSASPAVEQFQVWNVRPSDAGLANLGPLVGLRSLAVSHSDRLTPVGLRHLDALPVLQRLDLFRSTLPAEAVADFRTRRPKVEISAQPR